MTLVVVPLLSAEAQQLFAGDEVRPEVDQDDELLISLLAAGEPPTVIARELGITPRSVYRRLAGLRDRFGLASTRELARYFALRGF